MILTYQIISSNFRFPSFQLQPIVNNQRQPLILKDLYDHYEYVSLNNVYCLIFNSMTQIGCVCVSFFSLQYWNLFSFIFINKYLQTDSNLLNVLYQNYISKYYITKNIIKIWYLLIIWGNFFCEIFAIIKNQIH